MLLLLVAAAVGQYAVECFGSLPSCAIAASCCCATAVACAAAARCADVIIVSLPRATTASRCLL
jgi:hypothetical protein